MPVTAAQKGYGVQWKLGLLGSPLSYVAIAEVVSISGLRKQRAEVEATNLESPSETREYIAGLKDGAEVTVTVNLTAANKAILDAFIEAGVADDVQVVFPAPLSATWTFTFTPLGWGPETITPGDVLRATFNGRCGAITQS